MPFAYDSVSYQYVDLDTGETVPWSDISRALERHKNSLYIRVEGLAEGFHDGSISRSEWLNGMRSAIKDAYVASYIAGKGGRSNMAQSDWGRIGGLLSAQYRYLGSFSDDLLSEDMSELQIAARSRLYISSSTQSFERGNAASRKLVLPAYPGDGTSECMANCKCSWAISEYSDHWEAIWALSAAEHCDTCVERSTLWAPLYISK